MIGGLVPCLKEHKKTIRLCEKSNVNVDGQEEEAQQSAKEKNSSSTSIRTSRCGSSLSKVGPREAGEEGKEQQHTNSSIAGHRIFCRPAQKNPKKPLPAPTSTAQWEAA